MGIRLPGGVLRAKQFLRRATLTSIATDVPKGHFTVYVGEKQSTKKRYVVPVSFLNQPTFQELLSRRRVRICTSNGWTYNPMQ
ncbi:hypothetical protein AQUCO_00700425v1 [Aquilegia coerulea]|uniref:Auxin-responsive protein n=1 Tax=Aquilegia coerulea TaxID=218851 RepID=A0A2G5EKF8_AQUCA|nr:hypothetical protein AQUCO_00700425v1 [Aquilegia coerulea]